MRTTNLVAELLIIGLEVIIWVTLLFCVFFGMEWASSITPIFEKIGFVIVIISAGLAYLFGIISDEICDAIVAKWEIKIFESIPKSIDMTMHDLHSYVCSHSENAATLLEYARSRIRILRSSIFNFPLITIFLFVIIAKSSTIKIDIKLSLSVFIMLGGILIVSLTMFTYRRIVKIYWLKTLSIYYNITKNDPRKLKSIKKTSK